MKKYIKNKIVSIGLISAILLSGVTMFAEMKYDTILNKLRENDAAGLGTDDIANDSTVTGTTTSDALEHLDTAKQETSEKSAVDGYASLDSAAKVPTSELPASVIGSVIYKGAWDASTNNPVISDATGSRGWFYAVCDAGTQDLGSGDITFAIGDWVIHNGTIYEQLYRASAVVTVFGRDGVVGAAINDYTFAQIDKTVSSLGDLTTRSAGDLSSGNLNIALMPISGTWTLTNPLTITGDAVTFGSFPVTPSSAPTTDYQAANKKYVDDNDFWARIGTVLSPKTANDSIDLGSGAFTTTGTGTFDKLITTDGDLALITATNWMGFYGRTDADLFAEFYAPRNRDAWLTIYSDIGEDFSGSFDTPSISLHTDRANEETDIMSGYPITMQTNADWNDYIRFQTISNVPEITTVGACDLKITSSSGDINFDDENLTTTGDISVGGTLTATGDSGTFKFYVDTVAPFTRPIIESSQDITLSAATGAFYLEGDNAADDVELVFRPIWSGGNAGSIKWWEDENYFRVANKILLDDALYFTQTDGNEAIDSLNDGYMDYLATTAHRFNADVNVTGMVRMTTIWHAYGGFEDQSETITCGVGDWNHITNAGNNLWNLDENDGITITNDVFDIVNAGDYIGTLSLSISGLNGKDFHVRVYNNTQARVEGRPIGISTTGAANEMQVSLPIYIIAIAGDDIQIEIMSADGADPVVDDALFWISYLHD